MKKLLIVSIFLVAIAFMVHHLLWGNWGFSFLLQGTIIPPDPPYIPLESIGEVDYLTPSQEATGKALWLLSVIVSYTGIWLGAKKMSSLCKSLIKA